MSKNTIHNFNLSIKNSTDIKSSEDLTEAIVKELATVSKEMSQQKDIMQVWQEQNTLNTTTMVNNFSDLSEGYATVTGIETIKGIALSTSTTSTVYEEAMANHNVLTDTISGTSNALSGGGVADSIGRTISHSTVSDNTTSPRSRADNNTLNFSNGITTQTYASVATQQILTVPQTLQTNSGELTTEVVKAAIKKRLDQATSVNNIVEIAYWRGVSKAFDEGAIAQDFDGKNEEGYFKEIYSELEKRQLDKIHETRINDVNWREVNELMILKLSELSKEGKDVYLKMYYDRLIKKIKNPEIDIQQLFLEHDELFLLLKSIVPYMSDKISIQTKKVVYPNLSPQKMYPDIGVGKMYFIWSGTLFDDINSRYNERESQYGKRSSLLDYNTINYKSELYKKVNNVNLDEEFTSYNSNISTSSIDIKDESDIVPPVTKITSNTIQIGNKKWIDRFKFDYVLNNNEGGGEWMYNKAKKEMNASSFGAALIMAFAIEEGGWGKGNDQSNTHNAFSLLSKKAKSKAGTAHGNVITYANWDEGFKAFKDLISKKYASFNDLLTKDNVSADDINKALSSGSFHKLGGYTDSDKGKAILGVIKYAIIFRVHDIKEQIKTLSKKNELLNTNEFFKPVEENFFNPISKDKSPKDLEIEFYNNAIKELETEKNELETSYDKL